MANISEVLKSEDTVIVDVRTPEEFIGGNVAGSINIPMTIIADHLEEFKKMKSVVLCCASGGRSGQAAMYLKQNGIECINGGPWTTLNYLKNN